MQGMSHARSLPTVAALCLASTILPSPRPVAASPAFDLTGDPLGLGGLQPRIVASGAASAYFNPALLSHSPASLRVGGLLLDQHIGVELDGRPGTEFAVPADVSKAGHADASRFINYPIPTNDLQYGREETHVSAGFEARPRQAAGSGHETFGYGGFGLLVKLFEDHLALGVHSLLPTGDFMRMDAFFSDEREQYFSNSLHPELYGGRLKALSLALGAGLRLGDDWAVGVGTSMNLAADVVAPTYVVDTGNLENILIDLDTDVGVSLAPHFGIAFSPGRHLRLTATAHAPRQVEINTRFTFLLPSGVEQESNFNLVLNYTPWQLGAGLAMELLEQPSLSLELVGSLVYAAWGSYRDRHGERPAEAYPWADTLSPTLGVRYRSGPLALLVDAAYTPTPIPPQTGRSNYVGNNRVSGSLGGEFGFALFGTNLSLGLQLQAHWLVPRHQFKLSVPTYADGQNRTPDLVWDEVPDDAQISGEPLAEAEGLQTNNPGWPGFASKGWVTTAALYVRVSL